MAKAWPTLAARAPRPRACCAVVLVARRTAIDDGQAKHCADPACKQLGLVEATLPLARGMNRDGHENFSADAGARPALQP